VIPLIWDYALIKVWAVKYQSQKKFLQDKQG